MSAEAQGSWTGEQIKAAFIRGQYDAIQWALTATRLPKHVWETFEAKGWELHRAIEGLPEPGVPLSSKRPVWVVIDVGCSAGGAGSEAVGIFWTPGEADRAAEARDTERLMSKNQEGDGCDIFQLELP